MATKTDRASDAEIEQRVSVIVELLIAATPRHSIVRFCKEEWGVAPRTADRYIERARIVLLAETVPERAEMIQTMRTRLDRVYYKAYAAKDWRSALAALKQQATLYGLDAPARSSVDLRLTNEMQSVLDALERTGLPPSLVFNEMLAAIAQMKEDEADE